MRNRFARCSNTKPGGCKRHRRVEAQGAHSGLLTWPPTPPNAASNASSAPRSRAIPANLLRAAAPLRSHPPGTVAWAGSAAIPTTTTASTASTSSSSPPSCAQPGPRSRRRSRSAKTARRGASSFQAVHGQRGLPAVDERYGVRVGVRSTRGTIGRNSKIRPLRQAGRHAVNQQSNEHYEERTRSDEDLRKDRERCGCGSSQRHRGECQHTDRTDVRSGGEEEDSRLRSGPNSHDRERPRQQNAPGRSEQRMRRRHRLPRRKSVGISPTSATRVRFCPIATRSRPQIFVFIAPPFYISL